MLSMRYFGVSHLTLKSTVFCTRCGLQEMRCCLFISLQNFLALIQVKGQGIYAFVTLVEGVPYSEELRKSLVVTVRTQVSLDFF